jgi:hypothetical protein
LGEVGDWLSRTFSVVIDRLVAVMVLLWAIPTVGYVIAVVLAISSISGVVLDLDADRVEGFDAGDMLAAGVVVLATMLVLAITHLTAAHHLHAGHCGRTVSLSQSFAAALWCLPRALAYGFLVGAVTVLLYLVLFGLPLILAIGIHPAFALILVATVPAAIVGGIYATVRLSLVWVATAVAPAGHNPLAASWRATADQFWAVLGRLLILVVIVYLAQGVTNFGLQLVLTPVVQNSIGIEFDPMTEEVLLHGESLDDIEEVELRDFVPNLGVVVLLVALYTATQAAGQALFLSGTAGLYVRLRGPDAAAGSEPPMI